MKAGEYKAEYVLRYCKEKHSKGYRGNPYVSYDACLNCPLSKQKSIGNYLNEYIVWCSLDLIPHQVKIKRRKNERINKNKNNKADK